MDASPPLLRRSLGPLAITAQAIGTIGLTITAVINIPQAFQLAGSATWIAYALATVAVLLISETLVLFRHEPAQANGIAGYVQAGLGPRAGALATWALLLGYGGTMLACLTFFGFYLELFAHQLGLATLPASGFLLGGLGCLELARRDVKLSTTTMLFTEALSVLIVLGLCVAVIHHGGWNAGVSGIGLSNLGLSDGKAAVLSPPHPFQVSQIQGGLMIAVLSFIGFESAANLGQEARRPERSVPRALRVAVLIAGVLFLVWAVILGEGLSWLPAAQRMALDPITLLANRLGLPSAGAWIAAGAFLCLFGSSLGSLTALGRVCFNLAQVGILPRGLAAVHPRFGTPAAALVSTALPLIALGSVLLLKGITASQAYTTLGGFSVLGFLLVYGLVALASLRRPLKGCSRRRRWLVSSCCLVAVSAVAIGYLTGLMAQQIAVVFSFGLLMAMGWLRVHQTQMP